MDSNTSFCILLLIIVGLLFVCKHTEQQNNLNPENWVNYKALQFGNWETAQTPVGFYNRPEYREPYRWPVCHMVDYPVKHCRHL